MKIEERKCKKRVRRSCEILGELYETGTQVPKNIEKAVYWYSKACEGDKEMCMKLGIR
jgi:TPR repeat protein